MCEESVNYEFEIYQTLGKLVTQNCSLLDSLVMVQ